ncbi:MAG: 50S ribosomal protein L10 [Ardenticatenia bacterium]|nr:MAG: 50S ribosomal protein L10 [Ardenticatenia bacterium]
MAITREKKEAIVARYVAELSRSKAIFLTDYRGLTVANIQALRAKLREAQGGYMVVKNTLAQIALEKMGWPVPEELLTGPIAIGFAYGDIAAVAKLLMEYARETKVLQVKGGVVEGRVLDAAQVGAVADLPPREILMAQLLGLIQQPAARLAGVLNAAGSKLAATIQAYADKLESTPAAA